MADKSGYEKIDENGNVVWVLNKEYVYNQRLKESGIPHHISDVGFNNLIRNQFNGDAIAQSISVVNNLPEHLAKNSGLALFGPVQVGKTFILQNILMEIMKKYLKHTMYISSPLYFDLLKSSYSKSDDEQRAAAVFQIRLINEIEVLGLDDVGVEKVTGFNIDWIGEQFWELIENRMKLGKITFMTSNLKWNGLRDRFGNIHGERIVTRMMEIMKGVEINGGTFRFDNMKEKYDE